MRRADGLQLLFVHQSTDLYGSDRMLLSAVQAWLQARGRAIVALPGTGPLADALQALGAEVHRLSPEAVFKLSRRERGIASTWRLLRRRRTSLEALDAVVAGRRVEAVVSQTLAVLGGALWARARGLPHLWQVHEIVRHPRVAAWLLPTLVHRWSDAVLCCSEASRRWLLQARPDLAARARVLHNGVVDMAPPAGGMPTPVPAWPCTPERQGGEAVVIGLVGRINAWKGQLLLVEAAEHLLHRGCGAFCVVFVGSPPPGQPQWLEQLRTRMAASPLARRLHQLGFQPRMQDVYGAMDIVCVPSLEPEPFGLVAAEAMAAGLPVVAADSGGLPEIVVHGQTGLLHRPGDAAALAGALAVLLDDASMRLRLGQAGRQRYEALFRETDHRQRWLTAVLDSLELDGAAA